MCSQLHELIRFNQFEIAKRFEPSGPNALADRPSGRVLPSRTVLRGIFEIQAGKASGVNWQRVGGRVPRGGNVFTRFLGRSLFAVMGWRLHGHLPNHSKFIIAVAPHTSAIDFVLTIGVIWGLGIRASYLAKASLFRFPLGLLMRAFGGVPVDRSRSGGMVDQMVERFQTEERLILGITPEGTRAHVSRWKRGFALIAQGASVPILPAIVDRERRIVTFGALIEDVADPALSVGKLRQTMQRLISDPASHDYHRMTRR